MQKDSSTNNSIIWTPTKEDRDFGDWLIQTNKEKKQKTEQNEQENQDNQEET